ncbi:1-acyl-sn-glycerol-3-phosphate acyltransferase [uncultured Cocleimonas sp.]|uniref:1-acyl-sn-glycerol-3-phosphate acyltransferase n=1 Tax=uncultured Cocleimonas sp. TaxID=1051587 RepID=UPI00260E27ED|nr:1-acyl-sn-glycerol-3-phosphate acyltransferase [uncultured Cocleimonas sp.]
MQAPDKKPQKQSRVRRGFLSAWKRFGRFVINTFYSRFEVSGEETIPNDAGVILCANHVNALIDGVVLQASTKRNIRPLARSGLFENPILRPILQTIGAVPIYRRNTETSDTSKNEDSFSQVYKLLAEKETIVIFPEGQSHANPYVQEIKTGAARMALGAIKANGVAPVVIPVGMTFTRKKRARTEVLVRYGKAIDLSVDEEMSEQDAVRLITLRVKQGIESVTLNTKSWKDMALVHRLERFFALRGGKRRKTSLTQRFTALQRLIEAQDLLQQHEPDKVRSLMSKMRMFERLCDACGIDHYHLAVNYKPLFLILYTLRTLGIVLIGFPIALWGILNSIIPFKLTEYLTRKLSKDVDQYDTARVLIGMSAFSLFWGIQSYLIYDNFSLHWAIIYLTSLFISAVVAISLQGEYRRTLVNLKVFFLFMRKQDLKAYLETKRDELEVELAQMVRIAKRLSKTEK